MARGTPSPANDRGAILVHVALGILALVAFTTFVVDYGVLWASRRQAQNSADAGALAGAIALAYDDPNNKTNTGPAKTNAYQVSQANLVWGQPPNVVVATDVTFPNVCPDGSTDSCIRVDVYRNQARGNPLPMFFGRLMGLTEQGIKATATAKIAPANASDCLKPWAVPDKWLENYPTPSTWDPTDEYDKYDKKGAPIPSGDEYIAPTKTTTGTGFTLAVDYGLELTLKHGNPQAAIRPGWFYPVALSANPGGSQYRQNISECVGLTWGIGDWIPVEPGNMVGPTKQGVDDLIAKDPGASWDTGTKTVTGSCVTAGTCPQYKQSPRIVPIPIFDIDIYESGRQGGRIDILIVNILGFFIEDMVAGDVLGYLMTQPGILAKGKGTITGGSAFQVAIVLIR